MTLVGAESVAARTLVGDTSEPGGNRQHLNDETGLVAAHSDHGNVIHNRELAEASGLRPQVFGRGHLGVDFGSRGTVLICLGHDTRSTSSWGNGAGKNAGRRAANAAAFFYAHLGKQASGFRAPTAEKWLTDCAIDSSYRLQRNSHPGNRNYRDYRFYRFDCFIDAWRVFRRGLARRKI